MRVGAIAAIVVASICALTALTLALRFALASGNATAPDFSLVDQDGRAFTLASERGRPVAIFFGYTHCADACPVVLAHLAKALRDSKAARKTQVVFVTVDPARDDPRALKRYLAAFDPSFVGVTGAPARLEPVYAAYHVARITEPGPGKSVEIAHETAIFLVGSDGRMNGLADGGDDLTALESALARND